MLNPKLSLITPSIRPEALTPVWKSLKAQTYQHFDWHPRLSIPRTHPDLCHQMNRALEEVTGDVIVFVQDWITLEDTALARIAELYEEHGEKVAFTFPVGKIDTEMPTQLPPPQVRWDWRKVGSREELPYTQWEIDFGYVSRAALDEAGGAFDEGFDTAGGFSCENVELAWRLQDAGVTFRVDKTINAFAFDHEKAGDHEWRRVGNNKNEEYLRERVRAMEVDKVRKVS